MGGLLALSLIAVSAAVPLPESTPAVAEFEKYCLADFATVDEFVTSVAKDSNWRSAPPPESGRFYKSDRNYAWVTKLGGQILLLRISSRSAHKSFSTVCKINIEPNDGAGILEPNFTAAAKAAGLKRGQYISEAFYEYSGRLKSGRRAHARLSSAAVTRNFSRLSNNELELSVIY